MHLCICMYTLKAIDEGFRSPETFIVKFSAYVYLHEVTTYNIILYYRSEHFTEK